MKKEDEIIRAKGIIDGAATLTEAAEQAHRFARSLESLAAQGYELSQPIYDDYGFMRNPALTSAT